MWQRGKSNINDESMKSAEKARTMQERPLATILMPVYNSPDLFLSLESVRKQTYRPLQFVLIDDASETFEEVRIRSFFSQTDNNFQFILLRNESNLGIVRTLNRGLAAAEGKYIFNLADDDTFFDQNVIQDWVEAFEQNDCDAMTARRAVCDRSLEHILSFLPTDQAISHIRHDPQQKLFEYLAKENQISGSCTAWRREAMRRYRLYDEQYRMIEDYPSCLKLLREGGKIGFFDRAVIRYRSGGVSAEGQSVSETFEKDFIEIYQREIIPYVKRPQIARLRIARWKRSVRFDRWYNNERERQGNSERKQYFLQLLYCIYHPSRSIRKIPATARAKIIE